MLAITVDGEIRKEDAEKIDEFLSERLGEECKVIPMAAGIYRITPRNSPDISKQAAEKIKDSCKVFDQETKKECQKRSNDREFILQILLPFFLGFFAARFLKHE